MKAKNILIIAVTLITVITISACSNSQRVNSDTNVNTDSAAVKNMINTHSFVFIPRSVNAVGGRRRFLDPGYQVSISKDTIVSYMPFFGRGYTAPLSPTDIDYDFTSVNFSYTVKPGKHGWSVSIQPKDQRSLQELYFKIFDNGSASLNINSIDRSSVSYEGSISERKPGTIHKKK